MSHPEGLCVSIFFFPHKCWCCITAVAFLYSEFYSRTKNPPPKKLSYEDANPNVSSIRLGGQNCARNVVAWRLITACYMVASKQTCLQAEAAQYCLWNQFNDTKTSKMGGKMHNPQTFTRCSHIGLHVKVLRRDSDDIATRNFGKISFDFEL